MPKELDRASYIETQISILQSVILKNNARIDLYRKMVRDVNYSIQNKIIDNFENRKENIKNSFIKKIEEEQKKIKSIEQELELINPNMSDLKHKNRVMAIDFSKKIIKRLRYNYEKISSDEEYDQDQ